MEVQIIQARLQETIQIFNKDQMKKLPLQEINFYTIKTSVKTLNQ